MAGKRRLVGVLVGGLLLALTHAAAAVMVEWDFAGGAQGWTDEAGSQPERGAGGLSWPGSAAGISLRSPALRVASQAFQAVELTASCQAPGAVHLLWYGAAFGRTQASWQGPLPVAVPSDGQTHELRLLPFWQNVRQIEGLRLVATPGTRLRLERLRIVGPDATPVDLANWDFRDPLRAGQWLSLAGGATLRTQAEGLDLRLDEPSVTIISPPLETPAYQHEWYCADLTADGLDRVGLQWATTGLRGLGGIGLPARAGRHAYNVRCGADRSWVGSVAGLALELSGKPGLGVQVHGLGLHTEPQGPADLQTLYAGPEEGLPRVGRAFRLVWVVQNAGGAAARSVRVSLDANGASVLRVPPAAPVARMDFGVPEVLTWDLQAPRPVQVVLQADYEGGQLRETVNLRLGQPVATETTTQVPPPAAVPPGRDEPVLAVVYHDVPRVPLGPEALRRRLFERPFLGDYDPRSRVMDWQIKWCLEHGISAFIFDTNGGLGLVDAFLAAKHQARMGFCFRWMDARLGAFKGRSLFGQALAPELARPNYLRLQGKPVVLVGNAVVELEEGLRLADLRPMAASGLSLVAGVPPSLVTAELLQQGGYVGCADLDPHPALAEGPGTVETWEAATRAKVPHVATLDRAWDGPMTPERLKTLVRIARLRAQRADSQALPLVIVGDWNGPQGLEPRRPFGFAYLDAVREATGAPAPMKVLPEDVGMGPYDRAAPTPSDDWDFGPRTGLPSAMGLAVLRRVDGQLTAKTDTASPAIFLEDTMLDTRRYDTVAIGLAASAGTQGRVWWRTSLRKFTLGHSLPIALIADGLVHEYRLRVADAPGWQGYVEGLRVDPTNVVGASVALDYVRVIGR